MTEVAEPIVERATERAPAPVSGTLREVWRRLWSPRAAPAVLYLMARCWQLLMLGPPVVSPDTEMYRSPGQRLFEFDLVTFSGEGGLRPWPVTLPYALVSTDEGRV